MAAAFTSAALISRFVDNSYDGRIYGRILTKGLAHEVVGGRTRCHKHTVAGACADGVDAHQATSGFRAVDDLDTHQLHAVEFLVLTGRPDRIDELTDEHWRRPLLP